MTGSTAWRSLARPGPGFIEARVAAHWAAQLIGAAGRALIEARADDSHTNLGWDDELGGFVGHELPGGRRVGLRLADLTLSVRGAGSAEGEIALAGLTVDEGFARLQAALDAPSVVAPDYDLPARPERWPAPSDDLAALAAWYADAAHVLGDLARTVDGASEVRTWPHHFDIATLITVAPSADAHAARTVGVGLSPGDGSYSHPYFYVTPWPYPAELPDGAPGPGVTWHREGWTGAVMTADSITADRDDQEARVRTGLAAAVAACRALVDAAGT